MTTFDKMSAEQRSQLMRTIKSKSTSPEMIVRSMAHKLGYRFRIHRKDLPGKPDLVFPSRHAVIFVHGCFWHQHNKKDCKDSRVPRTNTGYWKPKLERNIARDAEHKAALKQSGWRVMEIWECQIRDKVSTAKRIKKFLD